MILNLKPYKKFFTEASFVSGSELKIMTLLSRILEKRVRVRFDLDIPEGYKNNLGVFKSYTGVLPNDKILRINFLLSSSDFIYSVDLLSENGKPLDTIIFDANQNVVQTVDAITSLANGTIDADFEEDIWMEARIPASHMIIRNWIESDSKNQNMVSTRKLKEVYPEFIRSAPGDMKLPAQGVFISAVKQWLKDNAIINPTIKMRNFKKAKASVNEVAIILPEEKAIVSSFSGTNNLLYTWREAFEDLEDSFTEMMSDPDEMPFGQLVYGNGGTGKSYLFVNKKDKYDMFFYKGAPNTSLLVKLLYLNRNRQVIIFDDADSVVTNTNSANILKMATDDTVGEADTEGRRVVYKPKSTGQDVADIEWDVIDPITGEEIGFYFDAKIVIITNLPDIKDQALKTRLYLNPVFMTKQDIIEKISETSKPEQYGCTKGQAKQVAELMIQMVDSGDLDGKDEVVSYRFFKKGLKMIKLFPDRWKGKILRQAGVGIRTSLPKRAK